MSAVRTQVYLTVAQREALDARARLLGRSMAELVREAVDAYLAAPDDAAYEAILDATFGSIPDIRMPDRDVFDRFPLGDR